MSLKASFTNAVPYDRSSERWWDITWSVAYHIAKDMGPISTVEKPGFIKMVTKLDPRYTLPSTIL